MRLAPLRQLAAGLQSMASLFFVVSRFQDPKRWFPMMLLLRVREVNRKCSRKESKAPGLWCASRENRLADRNDVPRAHSVPVYVNLAGKPVLIREDLELMIRWLGRFWANLEERNNFGPAPNRSKHAICWTMNPKRSTSSVISGVLFTQSRVSKRRCKKTEPRGSLIWWRIFSHVGSHA
jgi:hypothetical protein